jgi:hypothetical protein
LTLGVFKYYGFFATEINALMEKGGLGLPLPLTSISELAELRTDRWTPTAAMATRACTGSRCRRRAIPRARRSPAWSTPRSPSPPGPTARRFASSISPNGLTPGERYRAAMTVGGRETLVRNPDGVHLEDAGARVAPDIVLERLRADFASLD